MSITGEPDGQPQKVGVALVDVVAGLHATIGILAALRHKERTGKGQRVEVDLLSALLAGLSNQSSAYTAAGVVPGRLGNDHPSIAPYEVLKTGDAPVAVAVGNDRQFGALCDALGLDGLPEDKRFNSNERRVEHRAALRELLEHRLTQRSGSDWAARLSGAGVPAGLVNDIGQAFALAESLGLKPVVELPRSPGDPQPVRVPRSPIRLSRTPVSYRSAPPALEVER